MTAVEGAAQAAMSRGYEVRVLDTPIVGEARDAARVIRGRTCATCSRTTMTSPSVSLGAGETTVHVKGDG